MGIYLKARCKLMNSYRIPSLTKVDTMQSPDQNILSVEAQGLIAVERYKFIQEKIKKLDSQFEQSLNTMLKTIIALVAFGVAVLLAKLEGKIQSESIVLLAIQTIGLLLSISSIFHLLTNLAVMFSWWDYRKEEVELLNQVGCNLNRSKPVICIKKVLRWHETYLLLLLFLLALLGVWMVFCPSTLYQLVSF